MRPSITLACRTVPIVGLGFGYVAVPIMTVGSLNHVVRVRPNLETIAKINREITVFSGCLAKRIQHLYLSSR
jgi:hypothetical protein